MTERYRFAASSAPRMTELPSSSKREIPFTADRRDNCHLDDGFERCSDEDFQYRSHDITDPAGFEKAADCTDACSSIASDYPYDVGKSSQARITRGSVDTKDALKNFGPIARAYREKEREREI